MLFLFGGALVLALSVYLGFACLAISDAKKLLEQKDIELTNAKAVSVGMRVALDMSNELLEKSRNTNAELTERLAAESKRIHDVMAYLQDSGNRS
jgi:hypothetical protein